VVLTVDSRIDPTMKRIEELMALSIELSETVGRTLPSVLKSLQMSKKYSHSAKALVGFIPKSGYLCNAILNTCITQDNYSSKILMRSLIEHVFIHLYIYTRTLKENSNEIGKKYYGSLKAKEDLDAMTKIGNYNKTAFPEKTVWSTKGTENKRIRDEADEFRIERIFFYLIGNTDTKSEIFQKYTRDYLLYRIEQYTNFSSTVHGGPYAESALAVEHAHKNKVLLELAEDAWLLHRNLVETTYLFASLLDDDASKSYEAIKAVGAQKT